MTVLMNTEREKFELNQIFETIKINIVAIMGSDPEKRTDDTLTIGLARIPEGETVFYIIKETGFCFRLSINS